MIHSHSVTLKSRLRVANYPVANYRVSNYTGLLTGGMAGRGSNKGSDCRRAESVRG